MFHLLLVIIYAAFISLGLPDALLGSAWPSMYGSLGVSVSFAGFISMIIAAGTIVSSLCSVRLIQKFGTGIVTVVSVAMTAAALFGFSFSNSFLLLCLWAVPYGLGAGSVDAALNNFVALHYKSRQMSWLHSFWGIGAAAGPYIMGLCLTNGFGWNAGYRTVGFVQIALVTCLILSLPLWKTVKMLKSGERVSRNETENKPPLSEKTAHKIGIGEAVKLSGAKTVLTAFFCYCALESTAGLWAGSYFALYKGIDAQTAAKWASLFYLGITAGRFACGFISDRFGDKFMVRAGQLVAVSGALLLFFSPTDFFTLAGLAVIGLGCAPVFPSLLHATPINFGAENSQALIGMQMASAYTGTTLMPPLFGFIAARVGLGFYPLFLLLFGALMIIMTEKTNRSCSKQKKTSEKE